MTRSEIQGSTDAAMQVAHEAAHKFTHLSAPPLATRHDIGTKVTDPNDAFRIGMYLGFLGAYSVILSLTLLDSIDDKPPGLTPVPPA